MRHFAIAAAGMALMVSGNPLSAQARPAASAAGTAGPVAWVRQHYAPAGKAAAKDDDLYSHRTIFSQRLRALFADDERYAKGEIGRLEFDPFTGAQDDAISNVRVTTQPVEGNADRQVILARFHNIDRDEAIQLYFERAGGRWYIDDIGSARGWTLSLILKYGSFAPERP